LLAQVKNLRKGHLSTGNRENNLPVQSEFEIFKAIKTSTMSFIKEFKEFAVKGNVADLAIGVIIGGAFGSIVTSLINDVITPLLLNPALEAAKLQNIQDLKWGAVKYGSFLSSVISFIVVAFVLFMVVKALNKMKKAEEAAPAPPPGPSSTDQLLMEIRDALKK
jgi:large conductance mechanosensitive channel